MGSGAKILNLDADLVREGQHQNARRRKEDENFEKSKIGKMFPVVHKTMADPSLPTAYSHNSVTCFAQGTNQEGDHNQHNQIRT